MPSASHPFTFDSFSFNYAGLNESLATVIAALAQYERDASKHQVAEGAALSLGEVIEGLRRLNA